MEGFSSNKEMLGEEMQDVDDEVDTEEEKKIEPEVGMLFGDVEELFQFFKTYAKDSGFPARKRSSKKEDGKCRSVTFACARGGNRAISTINPLKPQTNTQTGCKARLTSSLTEDGKWRINTIISEHNHGLSPRKARYFPCNRCIDKRVKRQLEIGDIAGVGVSKNYNSLVVEAGGHDNLTFLEKDCRNYVEKVRQLRLGEGDAFAIQNYFLRMQAQNSNFFFSMDLDAVGRLKNVFWADGRSKMAYREFGDVITFDTTYLTNKYDMPFAPFVGVNHHGQSILFGCGLISSEDTETFIWLFKTWLSCMSDCAPTGIITDQDRAMQNAINVVFPNTRHRWCLWHVMKKLPEKFGSHKHFESICRTLQSLVYDTFGPEEFEQGWSAMLDKFELHQNTWLSALYIERRRWIPCFVKGSFWAGMSTTQRSESMNAFFDGYVNSKTTLKQFVEQYSHALRAKEEKENLADFKSFSGNVPCATCFTLEKQFQSVYTIKKFKEFQIELTGKMYCEPIGIRKNGTIMEYIIQEISCAAESWKNRCFTVTFQHDHFKIKCSCQLFEFRGIICRHAISVLIHHQITSLPDKYILTKWRKDVLRSHTRIRIDFDDKRATNDQLRYEKMSLQFAKVVNLAAEDENASTGIMEWLDIKLKELCLARYNGQQIQKSSVGTKSTNNEINTSATVQNPQVKKSKGAPRKRRLKSSLERISKKNKKRTPSNRNVQEDQPKEQVPLPANFVGGSTQESVLTNQTMSQDSPYLHHLPLGYGMVAQSSDPSPSQLFGLVHSAPEAAPEAASAGEVYLCGMSAEAEVPDDPEQIVGNPESIEVLKRVAATVSSHLSEGEAHVKAEQACFLPCTDDNKPLIGELPNVKGCYVATGHSCWGILNGPATGAALAELVIDGSASIVDITPFSPARFVGIRHKIKK